VTGADGRDRFVHPALFYRDDTDYLADFPNVRDFMKRVAARPAFQRAMKSTMPKGPPSM